MEGPLCGACAGTHGSVWMCVCARVQVHGHVALRGAKLVQVEVGAYVRGDS